MRFASILRTSAVVALVLSVGQARADLPSGNFLGPTQIMVAVDNDICRTIAVQCGGQFVAPANGNTTPVAIRLQVLDGGTGNPIPGIPDANISVSTKFVPAGGANVQERVCAACFQAVVGGVYGFFVEPIAGQTWKSGTYYIQVIVLNGGFRARALTEIKIPF
jgi:hypothetical protein